MIVRLKFWNSCRERFIETSSYLNFPAIILNLYHCQMYRLLSSTQALVLTKNLTNTGIFIPTSRFHNPTKTLVPDSKLGFVLNEVEELQLSKPTKQRAQLDAQNEELSDRGSSDISAVRISHPWPEWVELMERLLKKGYFQADLFRDGEMGSKDSNQIRTACLNFARDRFDLIRYFSRKDIQVAVGSGCPSIDRKVVNSGKRIRAHVGIDEGNVCSSCSLRGDCERAYVKAREDEGGRTVDVMRILLTYGLDPIIGSMGNKPCLTKVVKESVRRLLKQTVELSLKEVDSNIPNSRPLRRNSSVLEHVIPQQKSQSSVPMKQGDWICPKCSFLNFARNIRCLRCNGLSEEKLKKLGEDQDHLPLKKGDWLCGKCNFLNFAKNTRCLQCKENPPKRHLNPGEWECDSCNYINFRRNMVCLKCDYRRLKASMNSETSTLHQHEDGGYRHPEEMKFVEEVNDQPSDRDEREKINRVANMWRFVRDETTDDDNSNSLSEVSGFVDFPIKGGKTDLSQNKQKKEKWKAEMADRSSRISTRTTGNANDSKSTSLNRRFESLESSSDDDEMAEWFRRGEKTEKEKLVSSTRE